MSDLKMKEIHLMTIIIAEGVFVAVLGSRMQCSVSLETVEPVSQCPLNKEDWKVRENMLKCSEKIQNCTKPSQFRYHCVRDSFGKLIEVCAPLTILKGKKCPEFNYGGERIQEDNTATGFCITCLFSYSSNEVFNHSECLNTSYGASTNIQTDDEETYLAWVIPSCVVCISVVIIPVVLVRRRRMRNPAPKADNHNEESEAMVISGGHQEPKPRKPEKVFTEVAEIKDETSKTKQLLELKNEKYQPVDEDIEEKRNATLPGLFYRREFAKTIGSKEEDP